MDNIVNNIKTTTKIEKLYLICFLIGLISLFLPWIGMLGITRNGFSVQGYLCLILMLYPVICTLLKKQRIRLLNRLLAAFNLVFMFTWISETSVSVLGQNVNLLQFGAVIMLLSGFIIAITAFLDGFIKKKTN